MQNAENLQFFTPNFVVFYQKTFKYLEIFNKIHKNTFEQISVISQRFCTIVWRVFRDYGFVDKVIDGLHVEVNSINIRLKLKGLPKSKFKKNKRKKDKNENQKKEKTDTKKEENDPTGL